MSMPNDKSTKSLNSKSSAMFTSIISNGINRGQPQDDFERAKNISNNDKEIFDAIRARKAILKEIAELKAMPGVSQEEIDELMEKYNIKPTGDIKTSEKSNIQKLALLEAASQIEDPEIKAAILDMVSPKSADDPLARVERLIKAKQTGQPKNESLQDKMFMVMFEKMIERSEAPGQSPVENFMEMLTAVEKFKETTGQGKKEGDISTVDGLIKAREYMEKLGWIDNKSEKIESRKLDIEEKRVDAQMKIEEKKVEREFDERKENMQTVKEMSEILTKAATRIFDKSGKGETKNERSAEKVPVMMYCTNPGCKYAKEQFEIANPDQIGEIVETVDGKDVKTKGRVFVCPNDRGGCPNKYVLRENRNVEQFMTNIDPRQDGKDNEDGK